MSTTLEEPERQTGVQIELVVRQPTGCPVAAVSAECGTLVNSVCRSTATDDNCTVAEFTVADAEPPTQTDVTPVFSSGSTTRYRNRCQSTEDCVCALIESFDCPISDIHANDGNLHVRFYATDIECVREIVADARDSFDSVYLDHMSQSGDLSSGTSVVFDTGQMTDRQQEVLETAYHMGYFDHPKGANAGEVADELDIAPSTFAEHISAAQGKLLGELLED